MLKPALGADRRMLEAAKKIACQQGCSGLRVREVVATAGVNLGLFHYHFKNKQRFTRILLQEFYEEFFGRLSLAAKDGGEPLAQLRNALIAIARFMHEEHDFFLAMLKDIINGNREVLTFIRENFPRHGTVMRELIAKCQREKQLVDIPVTQALSFLMSSANIPTLLGFAMVRSNESKQIRKKLLMDFSQIIADEAIVQRIEIALKGLRP